MNYSEERQLLADTGRILLEKGLVARTWGNLSIRVDDAHFLITPSGRSYENLKPADMALVKMADLSWRGEMKPSSEKELHARIYRARQDTGAIIHTHQPAASSLAAARKGFTSKKIGDIPCVPYALPTTKSLARAVEKVVSDFTGSAMLLSNHGTVCMGREINAALQTSLNMEEEAQAHVLNSSGGTLEEMLDSFTKSHRRETSAANRNVSQERFAQLIKSIEVASPGKKIFVASGPYAVAASGCLAVVRPMLDDLAQLVGPTLPSVDLTKKNAFRRVRIMLQRRSAVMIPGAGCLCVAENSSDAAAIALVVEKACRVEIESSFLGGGYAISYPESLLMRIIYLAKYRKKTADKAVADEIRK
jgi:L-ribulose-5-phosphate 4-epimerase